MHILVVSDRPTHYLDSLLRQAGLVGQLVARVNVGVVSDDEHLFQTLQLLGAERCAEPSLLRRSLFR